MYTNTLRKLKVLDVLVTHRRVYKTQTPSPSSVLIASAREDNTAITNQQSSPLSGAVGSIVTNYEVAGVPFTLQCESFRSCGHFYSHIVEQAMRYATPTEMQSYLMALGQVRETALQELLNNSNSNINRQQMMPSFEWPRDALPFVIR